MATESQTTNTTSIYMYGPAQNIKMGQKMLIDGRVISHLSFLLGKSGSPTGTITFTIRRESDKAVLASKDWGDASALSAAPAWKEVEFDTPLEIINTEVLIMCEFSGGNSSNSVAFRDAGDVKASENERRFTNTWENITSRDAAYSYTYTPSAAPGTVTQQAVTDIAMNTATGNGNITSVGVPAATQHGHCWNTTGTPTIADSKTENGAPAGTGAFTSSIPSLIPGTTYYMRSYVTNDEGTAYSPTTVIFTARSGYSKPEQKFLGPSNDTGSVYGSAWNAQIFTPSKTHAVLKARFKLYRVGSPGTLTCSLRAVAAGVPTGSDLAYGTYDGNAITTDTDGEWIVITLDIATLQDLVTVDTEYALVLRATSGSVGNQVYFKGQNGGSLYSRGYRCTSSDSGSSWDTHSELLDILFAEEMVGYPTPNTAVVIH